MYINIYLIEKFVQLMSIESADSLQPDFSDIQYPPKEEKLPVKEEKTITTDGKPIPDYDPSFVKDGQKQINPYMRPIDDSW
jgi:hypothetical protein